MRPFFSSTEAKPGGGFGAFAAGGAGSGAGGCAPWCMPGSWPFAASAVAGILDSVWATDACITSKKGFG